MQHKKDTAILLILENRSESEGFPGWAALTCFSITSDRIRCSGWKPSLNVASSCLPRRAARVSEAL